MMRMLAWCGANHVMSSTDDTRAVERRRRRLDDDAHRAAEHLGSDHLDEVLAVLDGLDGRRDTTAACGEGEEAGRGSVAAELPREDARAVVGRGAEDERGGAVAEQDARGPIERVDEPRERFGADHEDVLQVPRREHRRTDHELVDETCAAGVDVERAAVDARPVGDERAGVRDQLLGCRGGDDREVDRVRCETRRA